MSSKNMFSGQIYFWQMDLGQKTIGHRVRVVREIKKLWTVEPETLLFKYQKNGMRKNKHLDNGIRT